VPKHLVQAVMAAEDRRFFEHHGVDARAVARAVWG
jgi:membrane peptidoglycan carboxypeptidase